VTIDPGVEKACPAGVEEDLVANRAGRLGNGQRRLLERIVAAYATSQDATAMAIRRALDTGMVRKVEGTFEYDRIGKGKGTCWQWTFIDREGQRCPMVAFVAPWPGQGAAYVLADSFVCIGSETPSLPQVSAARELLRVLQSLSESQIAMLDGGLMPEGITRGLRLAFSRRSWVGLIAAYGALSLVSGVVVNLYPQLFANRGGMYVVGFVFCGGLVTLLALSVRMRPAGTPVRRVEGPVCIGEARVGLESTMTILVGDVRGALPYWVGHALVNGSQVRAYVDTASNEIVAVLPA
jgi:hypothetical protein